MQTKYPLLISLSCAATEVLSITSMSRLAQVLCQTWLSCLLSPSWCWQTSPSLSFLNTKSPEGMNPDTSVLATRSHPQATYLVPQLVLRQSCHTPLNSLSGVESATFNDLLLKPHNTRNRKHKQESPAVIHFSGNKLLLQMWTLKWLRKGRWGPYGLFSVIERTWVGTGHAAVITRVTFYVYSVSFKCRLYCDTRTWTFPCRVLKGCSQHLLSGSSSLIFALCKFLTEVLLVRKQIMISRRSEHWHIKDKSHN